MWADLWVCSVHFSVSRLRSLLVSYHFLFESDEDPVDWAVDGVPRAQSLVSGEVNDAIGLVHWRDINFGRKFDVGRLRGVVFATHDVQKVDSVVKIGALGSHNGPIPVGKGLIIAVRKTIGDALVTELSLFSSFEFFKKFKSARFYKQITKSLGGDLREKRYYYQKFGWFCYLHAIFNLLIMQSKIFTCHL